MTQANLTSEETQILNAEVDPQTPDADSNDSEGDEDEEADGD